MNALTAGFHTDIPFEDYCQLKLLNASTICYGLVSLKHLKAALDGEISKDSSDMNVGRAIHARLLEPELYRTKYKVSRGCEAPLQSGARKGQLCGSKAKALLPSGKFACGKHTDQEASPDLLSAEEAENVEKAAQAVMAHPVVRLLRQEGGYETTAVFDREGVPCKMRMDKWIPGHPAIVDVKKIRSGRGTLWTIEKDILDYHYDAKAAWYVEGAKILTGVAPAFVWIFVEDSAPHDVRVIQADPETLAIGAAKVNDVFLRYRRAVEENVWPGYSNDIEWGGVPMFEKQRYRHVTGAA